MGKCFSVLIPNTYKLNCFIMGPSAVGKTMILYTLKLGEANTRNWKPTPAYNFEIHKQTMTHGARCEMHMWDLSGAPGNVSLWPMYYNAVENANVMIFVVNANNRRQTENCRGEFQRLVHETAFIHAQKLVINNVHHPAEERMSKDDVYEVLGIDLLDHETQEIDIIEMNASNYENVKDIEVKILNYFQTKLRGAKS